MNEIDVYPKKIYYSILDDGIFYYAKCPISGLTSQPFENKDDLYIALETDQIDWND